jgi:MFS family permease
VRPWRTVLSDRPFVALTAVKLAFVYCAVVLPGVLPIYLVDDLGLPAGLAGSLFALNCLMVVVLQSSVVAVTRTRRVRSIAVAGFFYAAAAALFVLADAPWVALSVAAAVAAIVAYTFGEMSVAPASDAMAADIAPPQRRGRYLSLYATAWSVGAIVGPLAGTAAFAVSAMLFWTVFAAVALAGTCGALLLGRRVSPIAQSERLRQPPLEAEEIFQERLPTRAAGQHVTSPSPVGLDTPDPHARR